LNACATGHAPLAPLLVTAGPELLLVRFAELQRVASWAIVNGGVGRTRGVAWLHVSDADLRPPVDPVELARSRLASAGVPDAVALLTSRDLWTFTDVERRYRGATARAIATVGLGNALRAGDPPGPDGRIGTINVLCHIDRTLSDEGLLEALALATEARTLAVRDAEVPSGVSGAWASGTGTDCIVIAAPDAGDPQRYAGKHTTLGHVIGKSVYDAVSRGAERWKRDRAENAR
jgi:adenosylcobinamide amidohydrolase